MYKRSIRFKRIKFAMRSIPRDLTPTFGVTMHSSEDIYLSFVFYFYNTAYSVTVLR